MNESETPTSPLSNCCQGIVVLSHTDKGTSFYHCTQCGVTCDVLPAPTLPVNSDEELEQILVNYGTELLLLCDELGNNKDVSKDLELNKLYVKELLAWRAKGPVQTVHTVAGDEELDSALYIFAGALSLEGEDNHAAFVTAKARLLAWRDHTQAQVTDLAAAMQVIKGSETCLNRHPIIKKTTDGTPWPCDESSCEYYGGIAPAPSSREGELDDIFKKLDKRIVNGITISIATDGVFDTDDVLPKTKAEISAWHTQQVEAAVAQHKQDFVCHARPKPDPYFHNHVCSTCSPDHINPGSGCINCRQTGYDQTPCVNCPGAVATPPQKENQ